MILAKADLESAVLRVVGCVEATANEVEFMFAEVFGVEPGGVASFEAEDIVAHEAEKENDEKERSRGQMSNRRLVNKNSIFNALHVMSHFYRTLSIWWSPFLNSI